MLLRQHYHFVNGIYIFLIFQYISICICSCDDWRAWLLRLDIIHTILTHKIMRQAADSWKGTDPGRDWLDQSGPVPLFCPFPTSVSLFLYRHPCMYVLRSYKNIHRGWIDTIQGCRAVFCTYHFYLYQVEWPSFFADKNRAATQILTHLHR